MDGGFYCPIFFDDFEDGNYNGWHRGTGYYTTAIFNNNCAENSKYCLHILGGYGNQCDGLDYNLSNIKPRKVSFYIMSTHSMSADGYFRIGQSCNRYIICFSMGSYGDMIAYSSSGIWHTTKYRSHVWYKVDFIIDWNSKVVDWYVDNVLIASNIPFGDNSIDSITKIYLYNFDCSAALWDEIFIYK